MAASPRNVVLAGFMGTGKSTVGALLAERLDYEFVDTDGLIEASHGPIPEIFDRVGEAAFREIERDLVAQLASRTRVVVATGGGLVLDEINASRLAATGQILCLRADVDELVRRLSGRTGQCERPLLAGYDPASRIRELMAEREAAYARFEQVETSGLTPAEVVHHIIDLLAHDNQSS
jgi:shikimate kinase